MAYKIKQAKAKYTKTWTCSKHKKYSPKCEDCRRAMYQQQIAEERRLALPSTPFDNFHIRSKNNNGI